MTKLLEKHIELVEAVNNAQTHDEHDRAETKDGCSSVPLETLVRRRCGTCKSWHKRDNYACTFNGPYGGGTDGVEGCKWKPKRVGWKTNWTRETTKK